MSNRNPSIFWGGLLVLVGVLFLLANLNVSFNWDVIWPILVIAVGAWLLVARIGPGGASTGMDSAEPRQGLEKARLEVTIGTGRLDVQSAALDDQLYRVHIDHGGPQPEVGIDRSTGTVRIAQRADWFMGARRLHVDARLADAIPWEVNLTTGAIRGDIDLSSAKLTGFGCRTGASTLDIALGAPTGAVPLKIEGGALTVRITRPAGAAIQVQASGAGVQLRADGTHADGIGTRTWKSAGYDAAADRYDVSISGAAVSMDVGAR